MSTDEKSEPNVQEEPKDDVVAQEESTNEGTEQTSSTEQKDTEDPGESDAPKRVTQADLKKREEDYIRFVGALKGTRDPKANDRFSYTHCNPQVSCHPNARFAARYVTVPEHAPGNLTRLKQLSKPVRVTPKNPKLKELMNEPVLDLPGLITMPPLTKRQEESVRQLHKVPVYRQSQKFVENITPSHPGLDLPPLVGRDKECVRRLHVTKRPRVKFAVAFPVYQLPPPSLKMTRPQRAPKTTRKIEQEEQARQKQEQFDKQQREKELQQQEKEQR